MEFSEFMDFKAKKLNKIKELSKDITAASKHYAFEEIAARNAQKILNILSQIDVAAQTLPEIKYKGVQKNVYSKI